MSSLGERIKALRDKMGFTQDDLAEALDMNRANISNYERGIITKIPSNILSRLADVLNTNADYLLGRIDDPAPKAYSFPSWASPEDIRDFKKMLLEDGPIMFDGVPINDEDRQKVLRVMEAMFWDIKDKNKKT
ncbi:XRE family transcriptional regulator [Paenibacillus polymyxa]|uniref:helix-turn-helix domain-containing protein n=1 Tax=Paenibacillus polymyxa TaxID=1406 RepID=UPI000F8724EF|nr:helix-turn-helix transcriptional regulator [Paenibacillus polymyxa]MBY7736324.1 helix-turn-helix domain-containing protein [Paenibacillus polymyxa]RTZ38209.1 XRE family transcriptional regulator [Paenibacillus polymyxa]